MGKFQHLSFLLIGFLFFSFHPIDKHKFSPSKSETEENASLFSEDGEEIDMGMENLQKISQFSLE